VLRCDPDVLAIKMIVFPNAKINLGLCITDKRADGYHNINSVFYPLRNCCDVLEGIHLNLPDHTCKLIMMDEHWKEPEEANLVYKAYHLLAKDFKLGGTCFRLKKTIPTGAGLGGGSADAAFAVQLLSELYNLNLSREQKLSYAAMLGSDVPFFIDNTPAAVSGRGEDIRPIELSLSGYFLCLIHPGIFVSTPEAYRLISPAVPKHLPADVVQLSPDKWKPLLVNDFEMPLFKKHPLIGRLKDWMYEQGALFALMSGSGSAVYGIFEKKPGLPAFPGAIFQREFPL
jgi:4-diphosphocytidyl-2-C-methyl-D-erythritol kinase